MRIFENKQGDEKQEERLKKKACLCMVGIGLLVIVTAMSFRKASVEEKEETETKVPAAPVMAQELENVYITDVNDTYISVFDGENKTFPLGNDVTGNQVWGTGGCEPGHLADIILTDGSVSIIKIKDKEKISEKVVSVSDGEGVELENAGWLPFAENVKIYCLYGELRLGTATDIRIGYAFSDFVLENGKICGVLLAREENMEYIRVQIQTSNYEGNYHDSVTLSCDTNYRIVYGTQDKIAVETLAAMGTGNDTLLPKENAAGEIASLSNECYGAEEVVTISEESSYFTQENGSNRIYIVPEALTGKISLHSVERSQGIPSYRGMMEILLTENGLVVINEVLLEEYLYAVVPSEMPSTYPLEALKAQAICARTYAYTHILSPGLPEIGAHVNDSTGYQVYNNIAEQPAATTAVKETAGQLLYVGEEPAGTYYYSTSCGFGTDEHVWKSEAAPELYHLTAKPVSMSAELYTAENMCEEAVFSEFIQSKCEGDFEKEEPWYRWSYEVTEINPEKLLQNLQARYAANPNLVLTLADGEYRSCMPEKLGEIKNISVIKRNAGGVADELLIEGSKNTYKVISELYIRYVLCDGVTWVCRQDGSTVDMASLLPSGFFVLTPVRENSNMTGFFLTGGGFGHGVGMSQNGAKNMALSGYSAVQILEFFFTDSEVRNAE